MKRHYLLYMLMSASLLTVSCSRKHTPQGQSRVEYEGKEMRASENTTPVRHQASATAAKPAAIPSVITVNDAAASRSVDGRLYYDVQGKRYWKNYEDGKYYLFNKTMYDSPAFKPPKKSDS